MSTLLEFVYTERIKIKKAGFSSSFNVDGQVTEFDKEEVSHAAAEKGVSSCTPSSWFDCLLRLLICKLCFAVDCDYYGLVGRFLILHCS